MAVSVEERVVSGGEDQHLQGDQPPRAEHTQAARKEDEERHGHFDPQRGRGGKVLETGGKFVGVPSDDGRQRLRVPVEAEGRQIAPCRIAAQ